MSLLTITCPTCGWQLQAQDQYAGRRVQCPHCGNICQLPSGAVHAPMATVASVPCALCGAGIVGGQDRVKDTNGKYYHRPCYDEACRPTPPQKTVAATRQMLSSPPLPVRGPRQGLPLGLWIGLAVAIPVGVLLLIVIQAILPARPSQNPATTDPATSGAESSPTSGTGAESGPSGDGRTPGQGADRHSLRQARMAFRSKLRRLRLDQEPAPVPPGDLLRTVRYDSPAGKLVAYLTPDPKDGQKHPAIVWITGGDCNSIGDVWSPSPRSNDQSARAFRQAGMVMMFPSLRAGNDNPGVREGFLGEIDDILSAADYLTQQSYVDPRRVYLGGHSTGGTIVLLVAECSSRFRAVFSFGPVHDLADYPPQFLPFDTSNSRELEIRSPIHWLQCIESPVFVFTGTDDELFPGMRKMAQATSNPAIRFCQVQGADHFNIMAPVTHLIATKILRDEGPATNITFTEEELARALAR